MTKSIARITLAFALILSFAAPAMANDQVTLDGGGWGHGIGMSQYGAKALAEAGQKAEQIVQYFYTGAAVATVGTGELVGHADPLRIGVAQNQLEIGFNALENPVTLCIGTDCSLTASPGEIWSIKADGAGLCQFHKGGVAQGLPGPCDGRITWTNQPTTKVQVPSLSRTYARGQIVIAPAPLNKFHLLVEIGLEEYLYGLGEMPSSWHTEALKAQAIAGRTYAVQKAWVYRSLTSHEARMDACACHLYSSTFDQKYIGWGKESEGSNGFWGEKWKAAVDATSGKALIHTASLNRAIQAFYFSSSGGATENNEDVWGGTPLPYLRSVADPGASSWIKTMTAPAFASALGFDKVWSVTVEGKFVSGSPKSVLVTGTKAGAIVSESFTGNQLRSYLGLRSHYVLKFNGLLPPSFGEFLAGDFDGDGKDEVVAYSKDDGTWWVFDYVDGKMVGKQWAKYSTVKGWAAHLAGDFDGDGKDDIASFHPGNGTWWISKSTGTSFTISLWADFSTASGWGPQLVGDFNGDGKSDIANYHSSNGTWWVSRSTGASFTTSLWTDFSTAKGWSPQIAGDFNGDGKDDIASFHPSNGTWWVSRSNGTVFATSLWADFSTPNGWKAQLAGDFTGDGKDDIAQFHPSNGTWWVSKSTGSSFGTSLWADFSTASGWGPQVVGDFDGDGKEDIAQFHDSNGTWWLSKSTGTKFTTSLKGSVSPAKGWVGQIAGDFDGDGDDDISNFFPLNQAWGIR